MLRIGIDEQAQPEKVAFLETFADDFLRDLLGREWGVGDVRTEFVSMPKAADSLGTEYDLILTPAAAARPIPFFVRRPQKQLWYLLASSTDEPFELALRNFLRESLFYGQYGAIYERSFGVLPDYGRIRELIDP